MCNSHAPAYHLVRKVLWCQLESTLAGSSWGLGIVCEFVRSAIIERSSAPSPAVGLISQSAEEPGPLNTFGLTSRPLCSWADVFGADPGNGEAALSLEKWMERVKNNTRRCVGRSCCNSGSDIAVKLRLVMMDWEQAILRVIFFFVDLGLNGTQRQALFDQWGSKMTQYLDISVQDQYNHRVIRKVWGLTEVRRAEDVYISYSTLFLICSTRERAAWRNPDRGQNKSGTRTKSNQALLCSELQPGQCPKMVDKTGNIKTD